MIAAVRYDKYELTGSTRPQAATVLAEDHCRRHAGRRLHAVWDLRGRLSCAGADRDDHQRRACDRRPGGSPPFFLCPDGNIGFFCFLPNPNLRPEVGKNKEVGAQPQVRQHRLARATASRQVQCVPQRYRGLHRADRHRPVQPGSRRLQVLPVPEHPAGADSRASNSRRCTTTGDWFAGLAGTFQRAART